LKNGRTLTGLRPAFVKISWLLKEIRIVSVSSWILSSSPARKTVFSCVSFDSSWDFEGFLLISGSIKVICVLFIN